jgi:hypothetical protein
MARDAAWLIVLQAVVDDVQLLLSLPLIPFTYQVVVAMEVEVRVRHTTASRK